ncbi:MAG: GxxExxY protein [Gemmataceae bacterium]
MAEIVSKEEAFAIMRACFEVCNDDIHRAQLHNYLKATGFRFGLLVNFGSHGKLQAERVVY